MFAIAFAVDRASSCEHMFMLRWFRALCRVLCLLQAHCTSMQVVSSRTASACSAQAPARRSITQRTALPLASAMAPLFSVHRYTAPHIQRLWLQRLSLNRSTLRPWRSSASTPGSGRWLGDWSSRALGRGKLSFLALVAKPSHPLSACR